MIAAMIQARMGGGIWLGVFGFQTRLNRMPGFLQVVASLT